MCRRCGAQGRHSAAGGVLPDENSATLQTCIAGPDLRGGDTALVASDWPGNVRQLEHTVERAVIMARGGVITSQHLSLDDSEG